MKYSILMSPNSALGDVSKLKNMTDVLLGLFDFMNEMAPFNA
jgi:hypothetical protein